MEVFMDKTTPDHIGRTQAPEGSIPDEVSIRIIRSSRRTLSLQVRRGGEVIVRAPLHASLKRSTPLSKKTGPGWPNISLPSRKKRRKKTSIRYSFSPWKRLGPWQTKQCVFSPPKCLILPLSSVSPTAGSRSAIKRPDGGAAHRRVILISTVS